MKTRRVFLSTAAGASVVGIVAPLAHAEGAPLRDPIYRAMNRYLIANAVFLEIARAEAEIWPNTPRMKLVVKRVRALRKVLARTIPTTANGLADYLIFVASSVKPREDWIWDGPHEAETFARSLGRAAVLLRLGEGA